jgi:hypothetical protein
MNRNHFSTRQKQQTGKLPSRAPSHLSGRSDITLNEPGNKIISRDIDIYKGVKLDRTQTDILQSRTKYVNQPNASPNMVQSAAPAFVRSAAPGSRSSYGTKSDIDSLHRSKSPTASLRGMNNSLIEKGYNDLETEAEAGSIRVIQDGTETTMKSTKYVR